MRDTLQEYPINALNKTHRSTIKLSSVLSLSSHFTYLSLSPPHLLSPLFPKPHRRRSLSWLPGMQAPRQALCCRASSPSFFSLFSVCPSPLTHFSLSALFLPFFLSFFSLSLSISAFFLSFLPPFFTPFFFSFFCISSFTPFCPNFSFSVMDFFLPLLFPHFIFPFLSSLQHTPSFASILSISLHFTFLSPLFKLALSRFFFLCPYPYPIKTCGDWLLRSTGVS